MKTIFRNVLFVFALLAPIAVSAPADDNKPAVTIIEAKKALSRYLPMVFKIKGVQKASVVRCDAKTGALLDAAARVPSQSCVAVKFEGSRDVLRAEGVFDNPLTLDGVLFHFTDRDFDPTKGGITVGNGRG